MAFLLAGKRETVLILINWMKRILFYRLLRLEKKTSLLRYFVFYPGTTYNFPINVWLMETHPVNPPTCFVKPTMEMQIQVSSSVDHSGKIYLPYLHEWDAVSTFLRPSPSSELVDLTEHCWFQSKSDLLTLIQVLISKFTLEPPVFSRPNSNSTSSVSSATPYPVQRKETWYPRSICG